jgi:hypothetical protein
MAGHGAVCPGVTTRRLSPRLGPQRGRFLKPRPCATVAVVHSWPPLPY